MNILHFTLSPLSALGISKMQSSRWQAEAAANESQQEIADAVGCSQPEVKEVLSKMATLPNLIKPEQSAAEHATVIKYRKELEGTGQVDQLTERTDLSTVDSWKQLRKFRS